MNLRGRSLERCFLNRLILGMAILAGLILVGMSLWISYDVFMRYVLARPTIWAGDLSEYGLLWATFLAAPWVLRNEGHVRIELLVDHLPVIWRDALAIAASVVCALVSGVFTWQTGLTSFDFFTRGLMVARTWEIPSWVPYAVIPVGSAFLTLEFILRAVRYARGGHGGRTDENLHI